jgi:hypothetical protein
MGLLAATLGSATVSFLAYGPVVVGAGSLSVTSTQDGVTRHVVRTLTERHGLATGGWSAAPLVVAICVPFLLIGFAAVVDAVRGSLLARVVLIGLSAMLGLITVLGIASIGLLLMPATLSAAAAAVASLTRQRHAPPGPGSPPPDGRHGMVAP